MKKIVSFLLAITILLGCNAEIVSAINKDDIKYTDVTGTYTYGWDGQDVWGRMYDGTIYTGVVNTKNGKYYCYEDTSYMRDMADGEIISAEHYVSNVYPAKFKNISFCRHTQFGGGNFSVVFDLDVNKKASKYVFCKFTLSDGSSVFQRLEKIDKSVAKSQDRDHLKKFFNENIGKFYVDLYYNKKRPNDVGTLVMHDVWYGTLKMEFFSTDNDHIYYNAQDWLRLIDFGNPHYMLAKPTDNRSILSPNGGKVTKHKAEILWNDIVGEDILYDVYVCTAKNNEKCKCDTSKLCKHYKKLTTTKKTSCVMTKWPKGKKLDLTKDKIIWIKIRAKKKIDGKWIVSNCLNTFVNEDDIK